jgi:hypothetical protein
MLGARRLMLEILKPKTPGSILKFATEGSGQNHKLHKKVMQCGKELDLPNYPSG